MIDMEKFVLESNCTNLSKVMWENHRCIILHKCVYAWCIKVVAHCVISNIYLLHLYNTTHTFVILLEAIRYECLCSEVESS